ncbi:hypothetical protein YC2023_057419 [Brassica napus]
MGKGRMVIAVSVNNDFEPLEKLTDRSLERDGPMGRESGRGWPINCGRSESHPERAPELSVLELE